MRGGGEVKKRRWRSRRAGGRASIMRERGEVR